MSPAADTPDLLAGHAAALRAWLFDDALPLWAGPGRDAPSGAFEEALTLDGRPAVTGFRRARVQARQVYVYAIAGALGWPGPWRELIEGALGFIDRAFRRGDGLYATRVAPDGTVLDPTPHLYDQAFFLFAGAAAAGALPGRRAALEAAALAHLDAIDRALAYPQGGWREASAEHPFQSNPHMHLFEAALAWEALGGDRRWAATADAIAELCLTRFIDGGTGALREFFAPDWSPEPGAGGRVVEPGHQFEWAWLLSRWGSARGRPDAVSAARRLYAIGLEHGVDPARGVAFNALDDALQPTDLTARLWPQTERIKAALRLGTRAEAADACAGLRLYLDLEPRGLWRDRLQPDGRWIEEPAPASSFYHIVCALAELFAAVPA